MAVSYLPGTITCERLFVIACASCSNAEDLAEHDWVFARRSFRERGWSKTVDHGWVCGTCKEELRQKKG